MYRSRVGLANLASPFGAARERVVAVARVRGATCCVVQVLAIPVLVADGQHRVRRGVQVLDRRRVSFLRWVSGASWALLGGPMIRG